MNYFKLVVTLLANASLVASYANRMEVVCNFSQASLQSMKKDITIEDKPLEKFADLIKCERFEIERGAYSLQQLLLDSIKLNRVESFMFLFSRARKSTGISDFDLFRAAYDQNCKEICDYLMQNEMETIGNIFWVKYPISELKKLARQYPNHGYRFVPGCLSFYKKSFKEILEIIDLIASCYPLKDKQFSPSEMIRMAIQNYDLSDSEMSVIFERLLLLGAEVPEWTMTGFPLELHTPYDLIYKKSEAEFKRMHPDHHKSYDLLFGEGKLSEIQAKRILELVQVEDNPNKLLELLGGRPHFKSDERTTEVLYEMVVNNRIASFKLLFSRVDYPVDSLKPIFYSLTFSPHLGDLCDFFMKLDFDQNDIQSFYLKLAQNDLRSMYLDLPILEELWKFASDSGDRHVQMGILEAIIREKNLPDDVKAANIARFTENTLDGNADGPFKLAIEKRKNKIVEALVANKNLEISPEVVELAVKKERVSALLCILKEERFKKYIPVAVSAATQLNKTDYLDYLLKKL